ncbi:GBF-interacting protein 1 [Quillaja saponaria]|uniref:GBF-interacting protein 1 n=1 Tax=Quillaja saponaria TaxID=32244 RepID=A0AAD7PQA3_QUISA|nr:GBF-interacting protein 1 [Quillaja saponaria]
MSGGGGGSRVPIPDNVRKTIKDIREITGKQHSDDDIYAVLKEFSMDPNETAQRLLYIDTFHVVQNRKNRKKEALGSRDSESSRPKQGGQGRGARGGRGNYSSNFSDGGGGRNTAVRRENGVHHISERGPGPSSQPVPLKTKNTAASQATRETTVVHNGAGNQSNGSSSHGPSLQLSVSSVISVPNGNLSIDLSKQEDAQPQTAVAANSTLTPIFSSVTRVEQGKSTSNSDQRLSSASVSSVYPSSLDPVLAPSLSRNPGVVGAIRREVGSQQIGDGLNHVKGSKLVSIEVGDLVAPTEKASSGSVNSIHKRKTTNKSNEGEKSQLAENLKSFSTTVYNGSLTISSSSASQPPEVKAELKQHVSFPNHFQVSDALKSGLTFGSFDSNFVQRGRSISGTGDENSSMPVLESSFGSDGSTASSNQSLLSNAQGEHLIHPRSPPYESEETPHPEENAIASAESKDDDQPKQESLLAPEGPPIPAVQNAQNYGLNFMSAMLGTQHVQFEGAEPQSQETSRLSNFVTGNPPALSSPSSTPPLQSSIPLSPQSLSLFRPPYPPTNFIPYGHYYPPFYLSPHQYLSHNGFPQQPSAGNMYLPTVATAGGLKFPLQQYKPGSNGGSFISPSVGYAPSATLSSGSSTGNEDLAASQLKENHIYTTGPLSEGAVWITAPGQDISSLHVNSMYTLPPQGQHLAFQSVQAGQGAFAGVYQPGQTVASPSSFLQHSQAMVGAVENVGLPSGPYQQSQHAQINNWNTNY